MVWAILHMIWVLIRAYWFNIFIMTWKWSGIIFFPFGIVLCCVFLVGCSCNGSKNTMSCQLEQISAKVISWSFISHHAVFISSCVNIYDFSFWCNQQRGQLIISHDNRRNVTFPVQLPALLYCNHPSTPTWEPTTVKIRESASIWYSLSIYIYIRPFFQDQAEW